jgi:nitroreductase
MFGDIIKANRSYRRFDEATRISRETLSTLVEYARLSPSGANKQILRYYLSCDKDLNDKIFPCLAWAAYLKDWQGPAEGERPSAYIIITQDKNDPMIAGVDHGIAAQSILLGATSMGFGGCMIGGIKQGALRKALNMPPQYKTLLVVALGKPRETVVLDEISPSEDIKYWRDENRVHHVPKRKLVDVIMN